MIPTKWLLWAVMLWLGAATCDAGMDAVLAELPVRSKIQAEFEEFRHSPARRLPGRFSGIMRWDAERGLSLEYQRPRQQWIALTPYGSWRRTPDGAFRPLPSGGDSEVWTRLLFDVFAGRLDLWQESLEVRMHAEGTLAMRIELMPVQGGELAGLFQSMQFEVLEQQIRAISVRRDQRNRIEIRILSVDPQPQWSVEEQAAVFGPQENE